MRLLQELIHARIERSWRTVLVLLVLGIQLSAHLAVLRPSTHSGQVAIPWMLNHGGAFFDTIIEQHAPGGSLLVAFFQQLLPLSALETVKLLNLALLLCTSLLVYSLSLRIAGYWAALSAIVFWAVWEPVYNNIMFYYDAIVGMLLLLVIWLWLRLDHHHPAWLAPLVVGIGLGGTTLVKQHGWAGVVLFGLWLAWQNRAHLMVYVLGATLFPALLLIIVTLQGNLESYLYWNWTFNLSGAMPSGAFSGDFFRKLLLTGALAPAFVLMAFRTGFGVGRTPALVIAMGFAGAATLIPRGGEYHVMGMLPALAVMSGCVLDVVCRTAVSETQRHPHRQLLETSPNSLALLSFLLVWLTGSAFTVFAPYLGAQETPAHDEFLPVVELLETHGAPGNTLYILPETDSTPQIHALADMVPPGFWIKGWPWYMSVSGVSDRLLAEWEETPPHFIVYFPELEIVQDASLNRLVRFMFNNYEPIAEVEQVRYHGRAVLYQLNDD